MSIQASPFSTFTAILQYAVFSFIHFVLFLYLLYSTCTTCIFIIIFFHSFCKYLETSVVDHTQFWIFNNFFLSLSSAEIDKISSRDSSPDKEIIVGNKQFYSIFLYNSGHFLFNVLFAKISKTFLFLIQRIKITPVFKRLKYLKETKF